MMIRVLASLPVILVGFSISLTAFSADKEKKCRVYSVDEKNNPWEEGFGVFGLSDSDADEVTIVDNASRVKSIEIGNAQTYKEANGARLTRKKNAKTGALTYTITQKDSDAIISLKIHKSEYGVVLYQENKDAKSVLAGKFDCSDTEVVDQVMRDDKNAVSLTREDLQNNYKQAYENISQQDFPFVLGDGYVDLTDVTYKRVLPKIGSKDTVGFLAIVNFTNTEYPDESFEGIFRFDRNGCLLSQPEIN